ncbi:MAG TPA: XRE family transcriptional regulator [Candidatus Kaiserbacteria bacterium]|nr:XRE family transcriptional regulator [Candidatus Kaiserbacteria bacterium]
MDKSIHSTKYKTVLQNLLKARHEFGLMQVEVAEKLKKPQSFVSKIERGERRLDVIELEAFAKLYKKSVDWFLIKK